MRKITAGTCLVTSLVLLLLTACTGGPAKPTSAAAPPTSAPDPTGGADAGSVNAVLAGLDGVMGDLQRILVKQRSLTTDVTDRLRSIYTGPELLNQLDAFKADVDGGLLGYKPNPGNRVTTVSRLITATPVCIFAEVKRDYSPLTIGVSSSKPSTLYVVLVNKETVDDPKHLNPTPWTMIYDGVQSDGSQPEDLCRQTS